MPVLNRSIKSDTSDLREIEFEEGSTSKRIESSRAASSRDSSHQRYFMMNSGSRRGRRGTPWRKKLEF
jgi:hypothetical protein